MKLLALLAGLLIERLATQLFHLRQLRWLDRIIDAGFRQADKAPGIPALVPVVVLTFLLVLPLLLLVGFFGQLLYDFAYLFMAIVILFFSLGPKDIGEQVDDYCLALENGDEDRVRQTSKALLERDGPDDPMQRIEEVEAAVCVQANNRLFSVIFWFILLGPLAAWTYRVTDLIRRRAVFVAARSVEDIPSMIGGQADGTPEGDPVDSSTARSDESDNSDDSQPVPDMGGAGRAEALAEAASTLHGWLAWIPARLTALGFALAGSFDHAIAAWRLPDGVARLSSREQSEMLLARVGSAALHLLPLPDETPSERGIRGATAANGLVFRLLGIWAVIIAAMTLYGWSV